MTTSTSPSLSSSRLSLADRYLNRPLMRRAAHAHQFRLNGSVSAEPRPAITCDPSALLQRSKPLTWMRRWRGGARPPTPVGRPSRCVRFTDGGPTEPIERHGRGAGSTAIISGVRFWVRLRPIRDGPFPGSGCPALSASRPPPVGRTGAAVGCELFVWLDRPITTAVATAPRQAYRLDPE